MVAATSGVGTFWSFYRGYTDTSVHTATMAGLTAFGLLTFVHRVFAALAVAVYVLPPVYLYLTRDEMAAAEDDDADDATDGSSVPDAGADRGRDGWTVERTPAGATLRDVAVLASGAVAVGDGGVMLGRNEEGRRGGECDGGDERDAERRWRTLRSDGPAAAGRDLTGVAATDDGAAAWVAGANGAVGRYAVEDGRLADHSAPRDVTDSWTDVAVVGPAGDEIVYLTNGSGEVVRGRVRGGEVAWTDPVTPGSGSSIAAADADGDAVWVCDTSGGVFERTAEGFARAGVDDASGTFTDVTAFDGGVRVSVDDGSVYRDDAGWTRDVPAETRLAGVDVARADASVDAVIVAVGDGGLVCRDDGAGWTTVPVPTDATLEGVALGAGGGVVVGANGTVLRLDGDGPTEGGENSE